MRVALLVSCVADVFEPAVAEATVEVLTAGGCDVVCPAGLLRPARVERWLRHRGGPGGGHHPRCPERGAGRRRRGDRGAGRLVCRHGATVLARALRPRGRCRPAGPGRSGGRPHHSCHLLRELRHPDAPTVLDAVAGCQRVVWPADERCCGFGGLFSVKLPEVSVAMADDKLRSLAALDPPADEVVPADASCLLHPRGRGEAEGVAVRTRHVAEVLAAALPRPGRTDGSANR